MTKITPLGSFSGRNAGDAAILGNLMKDISMEIPGAKFIVPTLSPKFIRRHFSHFDVQPLGLMPWNLSLKIFGVPTLCSMLKTDAVLITDNVLFDRKFFNPFVNFLSTIALFAPLCRQRKIPIVFYNASVGPIFTRAGRKALQTVLDASPLVILRDPETLELFQRLELRFPEPLLHADSAINTIPPSENRMSEIIRKEGLFQNPKGTITFTINAYIDNWLDAAMSKDAFLSLMASTADFLIRELDVDILFVVTQVMDMKITRECLERIQNAHRVRIVGNDLYTYPEIAGFIRHAKLHVGLRTHSLIFSAAVGTPMISINSYPKNKGFMRSIAMQEWMIDFEDLAPDRLKGMTVECWNHRDEIRRFMAPVVEKEKEKARKSAWLLARLLGPE